MASAEFLRTYDNIASVVETKCAGMRGVNDMLGKIRERLFTEERDPRVNRNLFVEPDNMAQQLRIPLRTAELVASHLHEFNILHIWCRAICPNSEEEDTHGIIVETDNASEFARGVGLSCEHCGQVHGKTNEPNIETVYAIHFDDTPDKFRLNRFLLKAVANPDAESNQIEQSTWSTRGRSAFKFLKSLYLRICIPNAPPNDLSETPKSLDSNGHLVASPHVGSLFLSVAKIFAIASFAFTVLGMIAFRLSVYLTIGIALFYLIAAWLFLSFSLKAFFSASAIPRRVATTCCAFSALCITSTPFDLDFGIGQNAPWHINFKSSEMKLLNLTGGLGFAWIGAYVCKLHLNSR